MSTNLDNIIPRAGTWIETSRGDATLHAYRVVPRAGTWIETTTGSGTLILTPSFPVRERGLKPVFLRDALPQVRVVPRAGTWIETVKNRTFHKIGIWSFPVRERGLKHL